MTQKKIPINGSNEQSTNLFYPPILHLNGITLIPTPSSSLPSLPSHPLELPAAAALLLSFSLSNSNLNPSFAAFSSSSLFLAAVRSINLASLSAFRRRSSSLRRWTHRCWLGSMGELRSAVVGELLPLLMEWARSKVSTAEEEWCRMRVGAGAARSLSESRLPLWWLVLDPERDARACSSCFCSTAISDLRRRFSPRSLAISGAAVKVPETRWLCTVASRRSSFLMRDSRVCSRLWYSFQRS